MFTFIATAIATAIASVAMSAQPQELPKRFTHCIERGEATISETFIGMTCVAKDGETWFAGYRDDGAGKRSDGLVTGP